MHSALTQAVNNGVLLVSSVIISLAVLVDGKTNILLTRDLSVEVINGSQVFGNFVLGKL